MRRIIFSLFLAAALSAASHATSSHAAPSAPSHAVGTAHHPQWKRCILHLDWKTRRHVTAEACLTFAIKRPPGSVIGRWHRVTTVSPHVRRVVTYPRFQRPTYPAPQPEGQEIWMWVTGYSWGCGTPNGITASGTVPAVGTVASNILPIGARVFVPSLGYRGVVLDRGAPLDLFAVNCAATFAYTGYRAVIVS